ncbi:Cytochrome B5 isoform D [Carex littledalei]|uniref:Cytochrome B5 isoform D n=1 Tax=Carex littledalei TaxID=544730 RepID=A0A833QW98_9POAL|nr:Cytochrome B5 isoform D [Carex littledalei]
MAEAKKFSASDVLLHTTTDDCWLLIRGKVYDVTKFLDDHPGGEDVLLHASDAFENVGHSLSAEAMMEKYLIGSVDGYVAPHVASGVTSKASSSVNTNKPVVAPASSSFNPLPLLVIALAVAGDSFPNGDSSVALNRLTDTLAVSTSPLSHMALRSTLSDVCWKVTHLTVGASFCCTEFCAAASTGLSSMVRFWSPVCERKPLLEPPVADSVPRRLL